jgi:hypothetical protein
MDYTKNKGLIGFVGGVLVAAVGTKIVKSQVTRDLAVKGLAKAMLIRQKAMEQVANLREDAEDLCNTTIEQEKLGGEEK